MAFEINSLESVINMGIKWKKQILVVLGILLFVSTIYVFTSGSHPQDLSRYVLQYKAEPTETNKYVVWTPFSPRSGITLDYFSKRCAKQKTLDITGLAALKEDWSNSRDLLCRELYKKFSRVFTLEERHATLKIPSPFQSKVRKWLGNNDVLYNEVYNQEVIHVINHFTHEHTIFNPLRDKRPSSPPDVPEDKYWKDILESTSKSCDFCNYKNFTAEHKFGRVESKYAFTASNIFKLDPLHALVIMKQHNPLEYDLEHFLDTMQLTLTWLEKAQKHHPDAHYPSGIWDVLPRCGASQVHPHIHMLMDPQRYHGEIELWRESGQEYYNEFSSNYFTDQVNMYTVLNLTATYGDAVAFANIIPKRDNEVVIMAEKPSTDFFKLIHFVLRAFVKDMGKMCYSLGLAYPAMGVSEGRIPAYARVVTRGAVTDIKSDVSSFELWLATNVNVDPYKTIQFVRESIKKRQ